MVHAPVLDVSRVIAWSGSLLRICSKYSRYSWREVAATKEATNGVDAARRWWLCVCFV